MPSDLRRLGRPLRSLARRSLALAALATVVGLTLPATRAAAQAGDNPISFDALARSKAGTWAEYTLSLPGQGQTFKTRYALTEKNAQAMAIEVSSESPMGSTQMRLSFVSAGSEGWKLSGGQLRVGSQPPQTLPPGMQGTAIKKGEAPGKLVGTETVSTPVGSFECKHYQKTLPKEAGGFTVDMWMSDKVLPTGLVKMTLSVGATMLLGATGTGAKPSGPATTPTPAPAK